MILCSNEATSSVVSHIYCLPSICPHPDVHIGSPTELKLHLSVKSVTVCAIGLLASDLREATLRNNWERSAIADLLMGAHRVVGKKRTRALTKATKTWMAFSGNK